jgi:hypothetical protein
VGSSLAVVASITYSNLSALASVTMPENTNRPTFQDRFLAPLPSNSAALLPLRRSVTTTAESKVSARDVLALRWMPDDFSAGGVDSELPALGKRAASEIPLPRSRPAAADLDARPRSTVALAYNAARPSDRDRSLLQKLSDLIPGRLTLASLAPNGGLLRRGPDLASLGYDNLTAVYDISARAVYLPNGTVLEAHSGLGNLRDNPDHVDIPNVGATPPAVYGLKPREKEFHGVAALRMIPAEGSDISGRSGLLVHSFMLGPNGDSNGCISVKDYDRFLKAFNDGEINRIAVIPSLAAGMTVASQNPT